MNYLDELKQAHPASYDHIGMIPEHMRDGVALWLIHGIRPGSFLTAVLCNDLKTACLKADDINRDCLRDWVQFFYNYTPHNCWGSPDRVIAWADKGGALGHREGDSA
jgi:hypothetical protein